MALYFTIEDVFEYIKGMEYPTNRVRNNINHPEYAKYFQLKELYNFYSFCSPCKRAVDEYEGILKEVNDLDNAAIKDWLDKNLPFFTEHIYGLGILYTDINHELKSDFYFPSYKLFVEREPFIPVIKYWELMWNLTN